MDLQRLKLLGEDAFTGKHVLGQGHTKCDPKFKVTQDVTQYSLHHMTCAPAKFEAATSNSI